MSSIRYALIDCNNFYVSCERVFNPKLQGRPVVILSNNDGCIIARSKEAKALSIPMGAPAFQHKQTFSQYGVVALSSNYTLYGDMSERVMSILEDAGYPIEVYSIDEAFLELPEEFSSLQAAEIRARVLQWTGIPISVGIGSTKTLAKVANKQAKQRDDGIFLLDYPEAVLIDLPLQDVWGIGAQTVAALGRFGIFTAGALAKCDEAWIQQHFSVTLVRTVLELRGISCLSLEEIAPPKKAIVSSRSFGRVVVRLEELKEAVATFMAIATEKLRAQYSLAAHLSVFVVGKDRFARSASRVLSVPTSYTPDLIAEAHRLLSELYREGAGYRKAGVILSHLFPVEEAQLDLFDNARSSALMNLIDEINRKKKKRTLFFASEGTSAAWKPLAGRRSPPFTTQWNALLTIRLP